MFMAGVDGCCRRCVRRVVDDCCCRRCTRQALCCCRRCSQWALTAVVCRLLFLFQFIENSYTGAPRLNGVYLVKDLAGPRGHVWVIGAQNVGKSTLINAFAKKGGVKATKLTKVAVPGTTLGILRIGGVLSAKAKMYDTPGLLHPYLISMRLNREEQKMVEIRKELRPQTYRIKASLYILIVIFSYSLAY
ncbi:putative nitric-oxide synthase (NADPH) [Helianthus debilis subsp. tardiflorus]